MDFFAVALPLLLMGIACIVIGVFAGWKLCKLFSRPVERIVFSPIPKVRRGRGGRFEKIPEDTEDCG